MSERRKYRAGDVVRHIELGEEWLLACDEWADRVCACGWPPSWNQATEVELVTPATDEERLATLRATAAMGCSVRSAQAQASLDAEPKPRRTLADVVANPPSGWTASTSFASGHEETHFDRRAPGGEVAVVCVSPAWASVEVSFGTSNLKRARALSRAVADLLDLLAEVSDESR
jgi:hypothetical protein